MKVIVYPADEHGCGYHRMIWPAEAARAIGCDVEIVPQSKRKVEFVMQGSVVKDVKISSDIDVVVFQRVTHSTLLQAVPLLRSRGIAVVIDVDDDLTLIHPHNPAFERLHPRYFGAQTTDGGRHMHSWQHLTQACMQATLVTVSTPALLPRYAAHGRGRVLMNYLEQRYYEQPHTDSDDIVWPASVHSHPNDPEVVGNAIARLVDEGAGFMSFGEPPITARAFGLNRETHIYPEYISVQEWAGEIAKYGIGIAPLADTKFNASKSWLKALELSAVGVPWVGSPRAEYTRLHAYGAGILASKPKDWYRALNQLRSSEVLRKELSDAGREAAAQLKIRDHAWRWVEAWEDAVRIQRS